MRVLGISGSLRRDSYTSALLRAAAERLPAGVELVEYEGLREIPPYDADLENEATPAVVEELRQALRDADAVLVATPEYNHSLPGQLKNALDWTSRPYGLAAVVGKPAGVISASTSSFGGRWAQDEIRKALRLSGAAVIGEGLAVGKAAERLAETGVADDEILAGIDDVLERLVAKVAEVKLELETADF